MQDKIEEITHELYWDCECECYYIHHKLKGNYCPVCDSHEFEMPDSHRSELYQYHPAGDSAVRVCPPVDKMYDGPGPRLQRVLEAQGKLTPQQLEEESAVWEQVRVDAYFQDREERFRADSLI